MFFLVLRSANFNLNITRKEFIRLSDMISRSHGRPELSVAIYIAIFSRRSYDLTCITVNFNKLNKRAINSE